MLSTVSASAVRTGSRCASCSIVAVLTRRASQPSQQSALLRTGDAGDAVSISSIGQMFSFNSQKGVMLFSHVLQHHNQYIGVDSVAVVIDILAS